MKIFELVKRLMSKAKRISRLNVKKEMVQNNEVLSIEKFIELLNTYHQGGNFYYRGETKCYPYRVPSLYRDKSLTMEGSRDYYKTLFNETGYLGMFDSFTLFESLAELQHYGAKTRILDISTNPLVALFFACEDGYESDSQDGMVYVYQQGGEKSKYSDGHTVAVKLSLNFLEQKKVNQFIYIMSYLHTKIGKYSCQNVILDKGATVANIIQNLSDSLYGEESFKKVSFADWVTADDKKLLFRTDGGNRTDDKDNIIIDGTDEEIESVKQEIIQFLKIFCTDLYYLENVLEKNVKSTSSNLGLETYQKYLVEELQLFLQDFLELVNQNAKTKERLEFPNAMYRDIVSSQIVKSSKKHQRIINQSGLFIMPAFVNTTDLSLEDVSKEIDKSIKKFEADNEIKCFRIPKDKKTAILDQLMVLGVDDGFIYPDIEHKSKAILKKLHKNN